MNYSPQQLWEYEFQNQIITLKDRLEGNEIDVSDSVLEDYYEKNQHLFNSRNRYDSYTENIAAVKIHLIDEKFAELVEKAVTGKHVGIDMDKVNKVDL